MTLIANGHEQGSAYWLARQKDEIATLRSQISALQTEAKHWKDQHTNEVKRAKIIKDTGDVPLQRIQAYERMGELQGQVDKLTKRHEEMRASGVASAWREEKLKEARDKAETECDQLRAEVERLKEEHGNACHLVAKMHHAATGSHDGPTIGVVEDVAYAVSTSYEKGAESMRERIEAELWDESENSAPCWCKEAVDGMGGDTCDCCHFLANMGDRIRALPLKENEV